MVAVGGSGVVMVVRGFLARRRDGGCGAVLVLWVADAVDGEGFGDC